MKKKIRSQYVYTLVPSLVVLAVALLANRLYGMGLIAFTRDVTTLGGLPFYAGIISTFGIFLWGIGAALCLFSGMIFRYLRKVDLQWFFLVASAISAYLMLDDLLLIHEHSGSWLRGGEKAIVLFLAAAVCCQLFFFKKIILRSNYPMLLIAFGMLATSVFVDSFQPFLWEKGDFHTLMEDGTKWLGIVCWTSYYAETSYRFIVEELKGRG